MMFQCYKLLTEGDLPFLQNEGHAGEFHVSSVQLPSNCVGSADARTTLGPATQREMLVHTIGQSAAVSFVRSQAHMPQPVAQQALAEASGLQGESVRRSLDGSKHCVRTAEVGWIRLRIAIGRQTTAAQGSAQHVVIPALLFMEVIAHELLGLRLWVCDRIR